MLRFTKGDMFATPADIRVNTVNCVGVMGAGVALAFKERFPEMFREYRQLCETGQMQPGKLHVWKNLSGDWIVNFPTKRHWRENSRYEDIESGLVALRDYLSKQGKVSVTLPALGSGHGGLDWSRVSAMIQEHLEGLEAEIIVFDPLDSRNIKRLKSPTSSPEPSTITKDNASFPPALSNSNWGEIYFQGDVGILKDSGLTIALSLKPSEREEMAAISSISELSASDLTLSVTLGNATATKLAGVALRQGLRVAAWVPQGLSRYRLPSALREVPQPQNLLLLSLAKPQQSWNPRLAFQSKIASLVTSKAALVTDPEPTWLTSLKEACTGKSCTRLFYIRYQTSETVFEKHSEWLSAKAIGRRSCDGKPNLTPILSELGLDASQDTVPDKPQVISGEPAVIERSEVLPRQADEPYSQAQQNRLVVFPKRLIEVDLPIKRISAHARREKSIRHGHISTLHIWWARRPLAACRAVICAALWFDPADEICPLEFREAVRHEMRKWARDNRGLMSAESYEHFEAVQKKPALLNDDEMLRTLLLDFIADFANWDNSTRKEYLETSRALTGAAHLAAGGEPGTRPLVVDPFAGGGAIPLEALRVGADAFASDLNPVAVLLNKVVLEYIPRYGQQLADEVRKWGAWVKAEAEKELAEFYPKDPDGSTPIAYLWARTIVCEGPSCGAEVPLIRSLWLAKKGKRSVALNILVHKSEKKVDFEILANAKVSDVARGTSAGGAATCPVCGFTTAVESVRRQLVLRRGGSADARLLAVVVKRDNESGQVFRLPTKQDEEVVKAAASSLKRRAETKSSSLALVPDGTLNHLRGFFNVVLYGITEWRDLFTPRQALTLSTFARLIREMPLNTGGINDVGLAEAVRTCLAITLDRVAVRCTANCIWDATTGCIMQVFNQGQSLPARWEFAEMMPCIEGGSGWATSVDYAIKVIEHNFSIPSVGQVQQSSATRHPLPDDSAQAVITDPPYYAAIPYADLSDFFFSWLKRSLYGFHQELLEPELVRKQEELVSLSHRAAMYREKDGAWFEDGIRQACAESRRVCMPTGLGVFVFANKETQAWEAMLAGLIDAGWIVTASWAIDTESGNRLRAKDSAALASSIHLACRPRENTGGSVRANDIGDWRDVLRELPIRIHEWMPRLAKEGVVGADAIFACLGPALEVFSRYSRVEKASGEQVTLSEYLEYVWAAVAKEALTLIFAGETDADVTGFEEDARLTAMWLWTLFAGVKSEDDKQRADGDVGADNDDEEPSGKSAKPGGFILEYDAARKIAQGLGAHLEELTQLVEVKGDKARLLPVAERTKHLFGKDEAEAPRKSGRKKDKQPNLFDALDDMEAEAGGWGDKTAPQLGDTVLDRVHQAMILFAAGRGDAMKRFLVDDGVGNDERFWRLANALSALYPSGGDEKRWVDGVLARKKGLGF